MSELIFHRNKKYAGKLPDRHKAELWTEVLFRWLFSIGEEHKTYTDFLIQENALKNTLSELLENIISDKKKVADTTVWFFENINSVHAKLEKDLEAVLEFDPAARSLSEVIVAYPGFFAIAVYRLSHLLWEQKVPVLPRLISEYVHSKTGIDIHPGAKIGSRFFIDHGTGIVIGETSVIGDNVKMYQGVTLGALTVSKDKAETKRHPTIGSNVIIYANATILGGDTLVGDNALIGGNVWITGSIPENALVYHKSEVVIKSKEKFPEPLNFVI